MVVGSGISGLTATLLLALTGRRVLLLEKAPRIGGSLARFQRRGVPFDTGFHFTGAFSENGILYDMLSVLGIRDAIRPIFLDCDCAHRFVFEPEGRELEVPCGMDRFRRRLKAAFPGEQQAVDRYSDSIISVCARTSSMDLRRISVAPNILQEDTVSLQAVLDDLTNDAMLKAVLSGFSMCYGVQPREISFANHSRICLGMYESMARVADGGEAFIRAFQEQFQSLDVTVETGKVITDCVDIAHDKVGRFVLNTGEDIAVENTILTIHPKAILDLLPRDHLSRAFVDRVSDFESSSGFFSVFGIMDKPVDDTYDPTIVSLFPDLDVNGMLDPAREGDSALVMIRGLESVHGEPREVITAFEPSFPERVKAWTDTRTGRRPPAYRAYKEARSARILERMGAYSDVYRRDFKMIDSASILTFRDYLNSPDGSAYGVKQKMGQFNLFGKLPLRNLYAAGQSSVLPGLVGAMVSSFIVIRAVLGKDTYSELMKVLGS